MIYIYFTLLIFLALIAVTYEYYVQEKRIRVIKNTNKQHVEFIEYLIEKDVSSMLELIECLKSHNPTLLNKLQKFASQGLESWDGDSNSWVEEYSEVLEMLL